MTNFRLLVIFFSILLVACSSTTNAPVISPEEAQLKRQVDLFPKDTTALRKLVAFQLEAFENSPNLDLLNRVQSNLKTGLKLAPTDRFYAFNYYRLNLQLAFIDGYYDQQKWQQYYSQHPFLATLDLAPPAYISFLIDEQSTEQQTALLKQSIQSNPYFMNAYTDLAFIYYDNDKVELAVYLLEAALKLDNDNDEILSDWSHYNTDYILEKSCTADVSTKLDKVIKETKRLTQIKPQNDFYFLQLADLLRAQGKYTLASFAAKKSAKLDADNTGFELEIYLWESKLDKLFNHDYAKISDTTDTETLATLIYANIAAGHWEALPELTKVYSERKDARFYGILYGSIGYEMANNAPQRQALLKRAKETLELDEWQHHLWSYATQSLNEEQLLNTASNRCEESEARFAMALQYAASGKNALVAEQWEHIFELDIKSFYEYAVALNKLKAMR